MRDAAFFEKYDDSAAGDFTVAFADAEGIIPAGFMKQVSQQRGTEHETHLLGRHAFLQLGHHLLGDEVTLLNVWAVDRHHAEQF